MDPRYRTEQSASQHAAGTINLHTIGTSVSLLSIQDTAAAASYDAAISTNLTSHDQDASQTCATGVPQSSEATGNGRNTNPPSQQSVTLNSPVPIVTLHGTTRFEIVTEANYAVWYKNSPVTKDREYDSDDSDTGHLDCRGCSNLGDTNLIMQHQPINGEDLLDDMRPRKSEAAIKAALVAWRAPARRKRPCNQCARKGKKSKVCSYRGPICNYCLQNDLPCSYEPAHMDKCDKWADLDNERTRGRLSRRHEGDISKT